MPRKRVYPGLERVKDPVTAQSLRILFDKLYDQEDARELADVRLVEQDGLIAALQRDVTLATRRAKDALHLVGTQVPPVTQTGGVPPTGGGGSDPGGGGSDDGGQGSDGCSQAEGTGHYPGDPLTLVTVGKIVCGTGEEFASLKVATVDLPTREANADELVRRIIWHLQEHGFPAGRQNNSSTGVRISNDKITVMVDGVWWAYDIFGAWDDFTTPMETRMGPVTPARYYADGGLPD